MIYTKKEYTIIIISIVIIFMAFALAVDVLLKYAGIVT